jgi:undecaprenyl phosphate-alpha-L-ara4N flippase subunit ArnE
MLVIIVAVAFEVVGQMSLKRGAAGVAHEESVVRYWIRSLGNRWVQAGIAAYAIELVLWVAALNLAPLSVAFPMLSLSYVGVALAGRAFLGERLDTRSLVAIAMITAGASLVAWPGP